MSECTCTQISAAGMDERAGIRSVRDPKCPVHGDKAAGKPFTADSTDITADSNTATADGGKPVTGKSGGSFTADSTDVTADSDKPI